ncbi:MAG: S9 family peptidase [Acidimicrobiales bacterium]|nr:S9 family peptidase [Acidimicrobiales bacterium]
MQHINPGLWPSPLTSDLVSRGALRYSDLSTSTLGTWWIESRPHENGRCVICLAPLEKFKFPFKVIDITPEGYSARTRVHEYGGGAFWVFENHVYFSNQSDNYIYKQSVDLTTFLPSEPEPIITSGHRYCDGEISADGKWMVAIREKRDVNGFHNEIVAIFDSTEYILEDQYDFVASPRISPDGKWITYISWELPYMPWDSSKCWVARLSWGEKGPELADKIQIQPSIHSELVSYVNPAFSVDGKLLVATDAFNGWWNIAKSNYSVNQELPTGSQNESQTMQIEPIVEMEVEMAWPQWVFNRPTFAPISETKLFVTWHDPSSVNFKAGYLENAQPEEVLSPFASISATKSIPGTSLIAVLGNSGIDLGLVGTFDSSSHGGSFNLLANSRIEEVSVLRGPSRSIKIDSKGELPIYATFHEPFLKGSELSHGVLPPLIINCHGGPTSSADPGFSPTFAFFTSRGFAVVDVDYRGSSGYGRKYRDALNGNWGIVDVEDVIEVANWLVEQELINSEAIAIRGGSAGGYTVLEALAMSDIFGAGVSYYGVCDLELLAKDTHKFESGYLDGLIGPLPECKVLYEERSPINHAGKIKSPLLILQGLDDPVVPPNQAEAIVAAIKANGIRVDYLGFEGEGHGFRQASNIKAALDAELSFYRQVLPIDRSK